jgi:hypothetical protein
MAPAWACSRRGDLGPVLGSRSRVADLTLAATVWAIENPADREYFGITPFLYVPTGCERFGNHDRHHGGRSGGFDAGRVPRR